MAAKTGFLKTVPNGKVSFNRSNIAGEKKQKLRTSLFARAGYRRLDEFIDYQPVELATEEVLGIYLKRAIIARERIPSRPLSPDYENTYYIALRRSEFRAQIVKTMSAIHRFFLGFGSKVDIIEVNGDFYTASQTVRNSVHDLPVYCINEKGIFRQEASISPAPSFKIKSLAGLVALDYFFGKSDTQIVNSETPENGNTLLFCRIDNEDAFKIETLSEKITEMDIHSLPKDGDENEYSKGYPFWLLENISQLAPFQQQLNEMLIKIAKTDFSYISKIIKRNITTNESYDVRWIIDRFKPILLKGAQKLSRETGSSFEACSQALTQLKTALKANLEHIRKLEARDAECIIKLLEERHKDLRAIFKLE